MPRNIVITGASSGIGRALALHYAKEGVTLGLLGRHQQRLEDVAVACREGGAVVSTGLVDVRSFAQLEAWLVAFDAATPIDLLFANAGIMGGAPPGADLESPEIGRALIETNVIGVLNTVYAVLQRMIERRAGQIAIVSSLAGFTPVPDAPSYGASKSAVLSFGLALRSVVYESGVKINVVCPGYVLTPMTAQEHGQKPFAMSAERAAVLMANGLDRNKSIIAFPRVFTLLTRVGPLLPERIQLFAARRFRFKVTQRD
jgi:short-subunit dehydrogenase